MIKTNLSVVCIAIYALPCVMSMVFVPALTSLHLQLRTRYLLATQRSSWLLLIALMHKCDSCTFATERKQLFIDRGTKVNYYC